MLPVKRVKAMKAISIKSTTGHGGGICVQRDVIFEFAFWVLVEFKLCLIKELQRLKKKTVKLESIRGIKCYLATIKEPIIPYSTAPGQTTYGYLSKADLLNVAPFSMAIRRWQKQNHFNVKRLNVTFIRQGLSRPERLKALNELAVA